MLNDDNSTTTTTISDILTETATEPVAKKPTNQKTPYLAGMNSTISNSFSPNAIDSLLEKEMLFNKTEPWNKLDKTVKTQKLISYAEKYGGDNDLPANEIKNLKIFFKECLNNGKLQKNKDVNYDKDTKMLVSVSALHFNSDKKKYTLRMIDSKRVSTLKSLAPTKGTTFP